MEHQCFIDVPLDPPPAETALTNYVRCAVDVALMPLDASRIYTGMMLKLLALAVFTVIRIDGADARFQCVSGKRSDGSPLFDLC